VKTDSNSPPILLKLAQKAYQEDRLEDAIRDFKAAQEAFLEANDVPRAAEMANNLCVALLKSGSPQDALQTVQGTPQIFLEHGDEKAAAIAYGNLASALGACGDLEAAENAMREAVERFRALGEKENLLHAQRTLSQIQLRQGRTLEALISMQAGLENQSKLSMKYRILRRLLDIPARLLNR
jgi:tetratricopeptide (TPR) repeat protein